MKNCYGKIMLVMFMMMMFVKPVLSQQLIDLTQEKYNQTFWLQHLHLHTAFFKMRHRQITYSQTGHLDTITLIFQASKPFHVRWFRKVGNKKLQNSEVAGKLSVRGDPNFEEWVMRSGSLWAAKLRVVGICTSRDFETIVSSQDATFQYRIGTKVEAWSNERSHDQEIEAPDWLVGAGREMFVEEGSQLVLSCAAHVSEEQSGFTDELILLQESQKQFYNHLNNNSYLHPPQQKHLLKIKTNELFSTHKHAKGAVERHGRNLLSGRRQTLYHGSNQVVYQVALSSFNVSASQAGVYLCCFDRKDDRLLLLTKVKVLEKNLRIKISAYALAGRRKYKNKSSKRRYMKRQRKIKKKNRKNGGNFRKKSIEVNDIQVEVISCERGSLMDGMWVVQRHVATCIRCRAKMDESSSNDGAFEVGFLIDDVRLETILGRKNKNKRVSENLQKSKYKRNGRIRTNKFSKIEFIKRRQRHSHEREKKDIKRKDLISKCRNRHYNKEAGKECIGLESFINVADGGVYESTLTLHNPHPSFILSPNRLITCVAFNNTHHKSINFKVTFV